MPVFNLDRSIVEFPGTVMPSRIIAVQAAVAAGIAEYAVTWHTSTGALVAVGIVDVTELTTTAEELLTTTAEELLGTTAEETAFEELVAVTEAVALVGTAVGFPPFRQVQALEIFAGTLAHLAAYAGTV